MVEGKKIKKQIYGLSLQDRIKYVLCSVVRYLFQKPISDSID